jgi:hypothetical protein
VTSGFAAYTALRVPSAKDEGPGHGWQLLKSKGLEGEGAVFAIPVLLYDAFGSFDQNCPADLGDILTDYPQTNSTSRRDL